MSSDLLDRLLYYSLILLMLGAANFLPIVGRLACRDRFSQPVDMGLRLPDGRFLFGPHKTWRGLLFSLMGTPIFSTLIGFPPITGMKAAAWSMAGDLASSFLKRRMGLGSGAKATGLDQLVESALPLWMLRRELSLEPWEVAMLALAFMVLEMILSPILFRMRIRRNPH